MSHIRDLLGDSTSSNASAPCISFEFFPPKTEAAEKNLQAVLKELAVAAPDFVSVTYGAMGSTRDTTKGIVIEICQTMAFPAMAHLTCVGQSRESLNQLLDEYAEAGVDNILALSGDPVEQADGTRADEDELKYAIQLVELVLNHPHDFSIGVAAHPEIHPRSSDARLDRKHLAEKLALADFAITQFFFYARHYFRLIEELGELGVTKPVIPGVIPVINTRTILQFSDFNKVEVDASLIEKLKAAVEPEVRLQIAIEHALEMSRELLAGGAPGIHLYTLNQSPAPLAIAAGLKPDS